MQHLAPMIIERVNRFFGYEAIDKVAFRQGRAARAAAQAATARGRAGAQGIGRRPAPDRRPGASRLPGIAGFQAGWFTRRSGSRQYSHPIHSRDPEQMNLMKISYLVLASAALLATACNAEKGAANSSGPEVTAAAVPAPNNGDWSTVVSKTPEGGFVMGNPNAKVKLVEFGSLTCPHCAEFEEQGGKVADRQLCEEGPGQLGVPQLRPRPVRYGGDLARPLRRRSELLRPDPQPVRRPEGMGRQDPGRRSGQGAGAADAAAGPAILDHRRPRPGSKQYRLDAWRSARQGRAVPRQPGRGRRSWCR